MHSTAALPEIKTIAENAIAAARQQPDELEALMELSELILRATKAVKKEQAAKDSA